MRSTNTKSEIEMDARSCIDVSLFNKLAEVYKNYETKIETINAIDYFIIINPFRNDNILVSEEDGINFIFSSTSSYFGYNADEEKNVNDLVTYINDVLDGKHVFEVSGR